MANSMNMITNVLLIALLAAATTAATFRAPVAPGLSWEYYKKSCPHVESIIRNHLKNVFKSDIGMAAALLRIHFHDCFVQGCDASVLLDGSNSEKDAPTNFSLRPEALKAIEDLRALLESECGQVVSCADIAALAARDSVFLSGGPDYEIPLGRRDGLNFSSVNVTSANLPSPFSNVSILIPELALKGFNAAEIVALSGAHTIGRSHCIAFGRRLYPTRDPTMETTFADKLEITCPTNITDNTTHLDIRSPNTFDNKYYVDLVNRQGLFTSDQDLFENSNTKKIVVEFANDQCLFFEKFVQVMIKMGQMSVLTGTQGEVRANCSATNVDNVRLSEVVGDDRSAKTRVV